MIKLILFIALAAILLIPILLAFATAIAFTIWKAMTYETRFRKAFVKYQNEEVARMIATGKIWTGQTQEQLRDSKGEPEHIETEGSEVIWQYAGTTLVPRGLRVTFVNNRIRDWE